MFSWTFKCKFRFLRFLDIYHKVLDFRRVTFTLLFAKALNSDCYKFFVIREELKDKCCLFGRGRVGAM